MATINHESTTDAPAPEIKIEDKLLYEVYELIGSAKFSEIAQGEFRERLLEKFDEIGEYLENNGVSILF